MKAARGVALGLGLVPLARLVFLHTSAISAHGSEIPEVGIGQVHPICDPLLSECVSGDEQVQDELIAELEGDDQVTGEKHSRSPWHSGAANNRYFSVAGFQSGRTPPGKSANSGSSPAPLQECSTYRRTDMD